MGSVDLPDQSDEPSRAERARDASAARSQMREMPDPDERGRAYEATRVHASADERATTDHSSRRPSSPPTSFVYSRRERRRESRRGSPERDAGKG